MSRFLWIFLLLTGCHLWDKEPQNLYTSEKALQTPAGIQQALTGVYDGLQSPNLYGGNLWLVGELLTGELQKSGKSPIPKVYQEFLEREISPSNSIVLGIWKDAYDVINRTNRILENINVISDTTTRNQVKGECLYIRGLLHFELSRYFSSLDSGLAVPYIKEVATSSNFYPVRDSISVFYEKLIQDFDESSSLLYAKSTNPNQANFWAVQATLARLYFQQKNYDKAFSLVNKIIETSPFSLSKSVSDIFSESQDTETFFRLKSTTSDNSTTFLDDFYNLKKVQGGYFSVASSFKSVLDKDFNDQRRFLFYLFEGGKVYIRKFDATNSPDGMPLPLIRLPEIYLIRAEILAENQGDINIIREDYNQIRVRAGLPEDKATFSPFALLRNIQEERLKELAWEGDLYHDKKRKGENFGNLTAQDNRLVLPIPEREIILNPNLVQNSGY